ncbi:MAG TPA: NADH-quinone oxidoreductase subunit NuoE [Firmicutes bacterium]|nr:NADH-quinone oxidoreductase subunit NuoE [Bacillota bacterium]
MKTTENTALAANDPIGTIDAIVRRHNVYRGATIPILQEIQQTFGYVAPEAITRISDLTGIPESEIYSIVTFYAQFRLQPVGKYVISVCHGTACHLAGAERITDAFEHATGAKPGQTSKDGLFTLEKVACLGCCSLAPVVNFNDETVARVTPDKAQALVKTARETAAKEKTAKGESRHENPSV